MFSALGILVVFWEASLFKPGGAWFMSLSCYSPQLHGVGLMPSLFGPLLLMNGKIYESIGLKRSGSWEAGNVLAAQ